jgi:large subunit ribosomal protein L22
MIQAHATAKYIRTSPQKAGLVLDLIRGRNVNEALATLQFARKSIAHDIEKVLRSAIANAQNKDGFSGDVDRLYVAACYAGSGPSLKRVRPAPMGRAFRVVKRTAHLTVAVAERAEKKSAASTPTKGGAKARGAKPRGAAKSSETKTGKAAALRQTQGVPSSSKDGARKARKQAEA